MPWACLASTVIEGKLKAAMAGGQAASKALDVQQPHPQQHSPMCSDLQRCVCCVLLLQAVQSSGAAPNSYTGLLQAARKIYRWVLAAQEMCVVCNRS
jgi:hypothetical protein